MKKIIISICVLLLMLEAAAYVIIATPFGYNLRKQGAAIILSSQHREWAKYMFLPDEEITNMLAAIDKPKHINSHSIEKNEKQVKEVKEPAEETVVPATVPEPVPTPAEPAPAPAPPPPDLTLRIDGKTIERKYTDHYFKGKMITISNPKNVKTVISQKSNQGEQISVLAKRAGAIAAINANGFHDPNGNGNGGTPIGLMIRDGQLMYPNNLDSKDYVAGILSGGELVTGYYSGRELMGLGVQNAAGFKPQLIVNGMKMITQGDGGWGYGPRTAIAQKSDGSIIFIVVDGRQVHSIGASLKDIQDLLYEEGAVNAMSMDGGSSSSLYFNGGLVTTPSAYRNMERYLPNAWVVVPNPGQPVSITMDGAAVAY